MTRILYTAALLAVFCAPAQAAQITTFASDGCSRFPDGTPDQQTLWLSCCERHDFAYWKGGTYRQRMQADDKLEACVAELGEPEIGVLMYLGVRVGGTPFAPTDFRWGYGWPLWRGYRALSEEEQAAIEQALQKMDALRRHQLTAH